LSEISGRTGCFNQLLITLGAITTALLGLTLRINILEFQDKNNLYIMFGFPLLTLFLRMIMLIFYYTYDTPKHYITNNEIVMAKQVLRTMYREEFINQ